MSGPMDGITEVDLGRAWKAKKRYWNGIRLRTDDIVSKEVSGNGATLKTAVACIG